jgi:hypothetical protein
VNYPPPRFLLDNRQRPHEGSAFQEMAEHRLSQENQVRKKSGDSQFGRRRKVAVGDDVITDCVDFLHRR